MFEFILKILFRATTFFGCNGLKFVSMNDQKFKVRTEIININCNERLFYPCSVKIATFSGSCNNINELMIQMQNYVFLILLNT